ncbi:carboxymuconolactone decarboxylase family protein [Pseudoruegeria sp. HB172150]|uniref:carboxymuconolactone decarboxylase family protein n=1 Tax=Pseudoruegeria sp. HB172150 TaxID=2721164 RepID=UPI0015554C90|nr:carboxymuconolactone decarboxylase family protein [Pseudoruegeria sp. HB172150]
MRRITFVVATSLTILASGSIASAQQSAEQARAEAAEMMGGKPLPDIENYPDFATGVAWEWMKAMESGEGPLDVKTSNLIGLAVAAQIPCEFCSAYHYAAAKAAGATDQELAHAAAMAGYTRNWSAVLYGTQTDIPAYKKLVAEVFGSE